MESDETKTTTGLHRRRKTNGAPRPSAEASSLGRPGAGITRRKRSVNRRQESREGTPPTRPPGVGGDGSEQTEGRGEKLGPLRTPALREVRHVALAGMVASVPDQRWARHQSHGKVPALAALLSGLLIGVFAGLPPARSAAKTNIVEAVRYE